MFAMCPALAPCNPALVYTIVTRLRRKIVYCSFFISQGLRDRFSWSRVARPFLYKGAKRSGYYKARVTSPMEDTGGSGSKLPDDKLRDPELVRVAITPREPTGVRDNITDIVIFYCRPCCSVYFGLFQSC